MDSRVDFKAVGFDSVDSGKVRRALDAEILSAVVLIAVFDYSLLTLPIEQKIPVFTDLTLLNVNELAFDVFNAIGDVLELTLVINRDIRVIT